MALIMHIYITVDVELWPEKWQGYRSQFSNSFKQYILGETPTGNFGLQYQLDSLKRHNLKAVFLVESLFACEFGINPLRDIVDMIQESGQQVQLHAHPEWVVHMEKPIVEPRNRFRLSQFDGIEQSTLIQVAKENLLAAGAEGICAFRAGGFSANRATLESVEKNGFDIDTSVNICSPNNSHELRQVVSPIRLSQLLELPLTVYQDFPGHLRQLQVSSSSFGEFKNVLQCASTSTNQKIVMLSHSAELLDASRTKVDAIVVRRFDKMCNYLAQNRHKYSTEHFYPNLREINLPEEVPEFRSKWYETINRVGQQAVRRIMY